MWSRLLFGMAVAMVAAQVMAATSTADHDHHDWSALLGRHVHWIDDGANTQVDYQGFKGDAKALTGYLERLAAVDMPTFLAWSKAERNAFLINAYNAWTVALILEHYPEIDSIREIGGWFSSPWKQRFVELLGETRTLDEVEHELLRGAADFDEPRIHFAVNCASIGCPALRPEAYRAAELDEQLEDQARRFLGDRSRNSLVRVGRDLTVSPLFRWYQEDFVAPGAALPAPRGFLAIYADTLATTPAEAARIRAGDYRLRYTRYDWSLNDDRTRP
ncbi:MAG: DUF547 domain-containing protein [Gammaproteobacteria bacterium]